LATNPGPALSYAGLHKVRNRPLPMIAIPTTAGTGSEVTLWSVFTDDTRSVKVAIGSTLIYPAVALCDPELTLGLPPLLTAATGMDALAHAIECYTNNACQPISGALALKAIELIGCHLRSAVLNGRNLESRYGMMLAAAMAGIAMNPTRLGLATRWPCRWEAGTCEFRTASCWPLRCRPSWSSTMWPNPTGSWTWRERWANRRMLSRAWKRPGARSAQSGAWRVTSGSPAAWANTGCARNTCVRWLTMP